MARTAVAYGGVILLSVAVGKFLLLRNALGAHDSLAPPNPVPDFVALFVLFTALAWLGWWLGAGRGTMLARVPLSLLGAAACWAAFACGSETLANPHAQFPLLQWSPGAWLSWLVAALVSATSKAAGEKQRTVQRFRFSFLYMMGWVCGSGVVVFVVRQFLQRPDLPDLAAAGEMPRQAAIFGLIVCVLLLPWLWALRSIQRTLPRAMIAGCLTCLLVIAIAISTRWQVLEPAQVPVAQTVWLQLAAAFVGAAVGPAFLGSWHALRRLENLNARVLECVTSRLRAKPASVPQAST